MDAGQIDRALTGIARGESGALEALYTETRSGIYSFVYTYLRDPYDSEDATQTVYLKIKTNIHQYRPGTNGMAWMLQIAKHVALSELRQHSKRRYEPLEAAEAQAAETPGDGSVFEIMKRVLSEEEERIVILHVIWGYKFREIAAALDCPTGTVTSKYKRAADKVRKAWEGDL